MFTYPFGKDKGKPLSEVSTQSLEYLLGRTDEADPKYGKKNREQADAIRQILVERSGLINGKSAKAEPKVISVPTATPVNQNTKLLQEIKFLAQAQTKALNEVLGILRYQFPNSLNNTEQMGEEVTQDEEAPF